MVVLKSKCVLDGEVVYAVIWLILGGTGWERTTERSIHGRSTVPSKFYRVVAIQSTYPVKRWVIPKQVHILIFYHVIPGSSHVIGDGYRKTDVAMV